MIKFLKRTLKWLTSLNWGPIVYNLEVEIKLASGEWQKFSTPVGPGDTVEFFDPVDETANIRVRLLWRSHTAMPKRLDYGREQNT